MVRLEICVPTLFICAAIPFMSANAQTTPAQPTQDVETAEVAAQQAPRADLTPVNELVLEGSYDEAEQMLGELQKEFPEDAALLLLRGEVLLAIQRADEARVVLQKSLEVDADQPRAHFQLATALSAIGRTDEALERFAVATKSDDQQIALMARLNRSTLFSQSRKWGEAAQELEAVLELQPDNVQVYGDLASMYLRAGQTAQTAAALERGKQAGFESAQHYYSLGARLYRDKNHAEAINVLEAALAIEPGMAKAERSLAAALEKIGRDEEAVAHFRKYLDLDPDASDADQVAAKIKRAESR